jgi:DNA-binding NtrC family response regulator
LSNGGDGFVSETTFASERDILYKLFFDMKRDVTELKRLFLELVQNPNAVKSANINFAENMNGNELQPKEYPTPVLAASQSNSLPFVIQQPAQSNGIHTHANTNEIHHHEEVEQSLNIMDMEKDLIVRALKKHKGKRKDASSDLGISERTLYRKLKEYDIEDL